MAGLLDQLSGLLTPENVNAIAGATGIDANQIQDGLNVAAPLLQGGLATNASSGAGLESLTSLLGSVGGGGQDDPLAGIMGMLGGNGGAGGGGDATDIVGSLGPLLSSLTGGGSGSGLGGLLGGLMGGGGAASSDPISGLINSALGEGITAISKYLDGALGFKITPYIAMAAPFIMGLIKKNMTDRNMDGAGVADMLKSGNDEYMAKGGPTAELLRAAGDVGKQAAALKAKFSAEQWEKVTMAPLAAAAAIIYASPSGSGSSKEVAAAVESITEASEAASPTSLLTTAFSGQLSPDSFKKYGPDVSRATLIGIIKAGASAVETVDPGESSQYKALIMDSAQKAAEAAKEGGFLGFGGKKISDAEADVLAELHSVLSV